MKLVWENGGAAIEAPKKCRSGFQNAPNSDRADFNRIHHIGRFGAWAMQADIQAHIEQQQQKKIDAVMDIINRWNT